MSFIVSGLTFRPDRIRLTAGLDATQQAWRLVTEEGIPFREAYRRVAERFSE
jgi:argininosuccinate lyase